MAWYSKLVRPWTVRIPEGLFDVKVLGNAWLGSADRSVSIKFTVDGECEVTVGGGPKRTYATYYTGNTVSLLTWEAVGANANSATMEWELQDSF